MVALAEGPRQGVDGVSLRPAGRRAAIQGAKLSRRVAVVERLAEMGGMCINTGIIPSKTLREAVMHLSGYCYHALDGASYALQQHITRDDLRFRADHVMRHEIDVTRQATIEIWLAERLRQQGRDHHERSFFRADHR